MVRGISHMFLTGPDAVEAVTGELHEGSARNVICALARLDGHVVGVVGNQPAVNAGMPDIAASGKAAWFVRTCDAFNIPIVTLVDVHPSVMDSRSIGCDVSVAWPTDEIAVMGAAGAVNVLHRAKLASAEDPETLRRSLAEEYAAQVHPYYAAEPGLVDDVTDPADTRRAVISALAMLRDKATAPMPRKHGNPPP